MRRFHRHTSAENLCSICESIGRGKCKNGQTECECFDNFTGPTCSDPSNTKHSSVTEPTPLNMSAVAAGILGGILLLFIIGLIIFFFWHRRKKRKKKSLTDPSTGSSTRYVVTPPLYTLSLSRENSLAPPPDPNHIYEEVS